MNLKKRAMYAGMAAALALSLAMPSFATGVTEIDPGPYKAGGKGGDTIISVYETNVNTKNLSVEVPLYLTLAVVKEATGNPTVVAPDTYGIKNTSKAGNGGTPTFYVGIAGVHIDSLSGGWVLEEYGAGDVTGGATDKKMALNFSGKMWKEDEGDFTGDAVTFPFPAVADGKSYSVNTKTYKNGANLFYKNTYNAIGPDVFMPITVEGKVNTSYTLQKAATDAAVPQFRVTYTVCAVDADGNLVSALPYAGPNYGPFPDDGLLETESHTSNFDKDSNPINP